MICVYQSLDYLSGDSGFMINKHLFIPYEVTAMEGMTGLRQYTVGCCGRKVSRFVEKYTKGDGPG